MSVSESPAATHTRQSAIESHTVRTSLGTALPVYVASDFAVISREVARQLSQAGQSRLNAVVGLATGSTPIGVYDALTGLSQSGEADMSETISFNLDEYYPMEAESPHSYHTFMRQHLFSRIAWGKWHVPSGRLRSPELIAEDCHAYEEAIRQAGGIDLQLLGIGRTGHIGFNEPGSPRDSRTRLVELSEATREDAASGFGGLDQTPREAVSMGIGTIMEARRIILMATGASKAGILRRAFRDASTPNLPASLLQEHPNTALYLDAGAASELF